MLRWHEEWPLWSVQKKIYDEVGQVWVEIDDIPDLRGRSDGLRRLLGELQRLERVCLDEGIYGWISSNEKANAPMKRVMLMLGAVQYAEDTQYDYLRKFAGVPALPRRVREVYRLMAGRA